AWPLAAPLTPNYSFTGKLAWPLAAPLYGKAGWPLLALTFGKGVKCGWSGFISLHLGHFVEAANSARKGPSAAMEECDLEAAEGCSLVAPMGELGHPDGYEIPLSKLAKFNDLIDRIEIERVR